MEGKTGTSFEKVSEGEYWTKMIQEFNQGGELILKQLKLTELSPLVYAQQNLRGINVSDNKIKVLS